MGSGGREDGRGVGILAHRGGAGYAPENTLAAFDRTIRLGTAESVEFDVQRSSDGVLVVVHDADLHRTTDIEAVYPERSHDTPNRFTVRELKQLDCGSWFSGGRFAGERMPTLDETLEALTGKVGIRLEIKHPHRHPGVEEDLAEVLRRHALTRSDSLLVGSFEWDSVRRFHDILPTVLVEEFTYRPDELQRFERQRAMPTIAHRYDVPLRIGDPNSPRTMRAALDDPDRTIITTDYPDVLYRMSRGMPAFDRETPLVIDDVVIDETDPQVRTAVIRNTSTASVDCGGWYLWNGVATPLAAPGGLFPAGGTIRVPLLPPRGRNVSWIHTLALHDPEHRVAGLFEYWAYRPTA